MAKDDNGSGKTGGPFTAADALAQTGTALPIVTGDLQPVDGPISLEMVEVGEVTGANSALATPADPWIGYPVGGRYRITRLLGHGGMGMVYAAHDENLGRPVVVKILHGARLMDEQARQRFRKEAQITAQLAHPNSVRVYDFGVLEDGQMYIVLEQLEGQDLADLLEQQRPLPLPLALTIVSQVCAAIIEAHSRQIIHRDLKPENIFLVAGRDGQPDWVKVLDFGIARVMRDSATKVTVDGSLLGTPVYLAPEQLRLSGDQLDGRIDVYALAAIFYELLVGSPPHGSDDITLVVARKVSPDSVPPVRTTRLDVPEALDALIRRSLARNRDDRPASMAEFARLLSEAMMATSTALSAVPADMPPAVTHEPRLLESLVPVQVARRLRGRGLVLGIGAVAGLLLAVLAIVLLSGDNQPAHPPAVDQLGEPVPTAVEAVPEQGNVPRPALPYTPAPVVSAVPSVTRTKSDGGVRAPAKRGKRQKARTRSRVQFPTPDTQGEPIIVTP